MHKTVNKSFILVHTGCAVWSRLDWLSLKRMKRAKHRSWWWYPHRGCSTIWMGCDGESCWSSSIVTILPSCYRGKKDGKQLLILEDPSPVNFDFLQVCLVYGGLCTLSCVAGSNNGKVTENQGVTKFHPLRSLSVGIRGCIANFNPWPPGSLRPRLCKVGMTQLSLWYRGSCVSSGVSLLQCFPISLPEKSAQATELLELKCHKGFSRIQI